jgi:hypothetical protein
MYTARKELVHDLNKLMREFKLDLRSIFKLELSLLRELHNDLHLALQQQLHLTYTILDQQGPFEVIYSIKLNALLNIYMIDTELEVILMRRSEPHYLSPASYMDYNGQLLSPTFVLKMQSESYSGCSMTTMKEMELLSNGIHLHLPLKPMTQIHLIGMKP